MRKMVLWLVLPALFVPPVFGDEAAARREFVERAKAVAPDDVTGHYVLALWCREQGLSDEARLEFERVVALSPDHEGARRELGYERCGTIWLSREEAMKAKGLVRHDGAWLLPEEVAALSLPKSERERVKAEQARVRDLLKQMSDGGPKIERIAMLALAGIDDAVKVEPLSYALRYPAESVRTFAAKELGRIGDRRALRPLIHRSIVDSSDGVRAAAVEAVKKFKDPNAMAPYLRALASEKPAMRIGAVAAIGEFEEPIGIEYLLWHVEKHGGGINRSHIYTVNQLSFIQDFDVEVAQTAFIADPIVGIIQEGQVLDAKVLATDGECDIVERRVIYRTLKRLSGQDFGEDIDAYARWWAEHRAELVTAR